MTLRELEKELNALHELMDGSIDSVTDAATNAQEVIFKFLSEYINNFEVSDGRFVATQDYAARFSYIQRKIETIIGNIFTPSLKDYLPVFSTVEQTNIALQKSYNQLEIDLELLSPIRKSIYNQAVYYLKGGLADAYIQPTKYLLMQSVSNGISLKDAQRLLRKWDKGELAAGSQLTSGRATPNLNKYANQVSRDSIYGYDGAINETIAQEYQLTSFVYVGDLIRDSRPICKHLVGLNRKIKLEELPPLFVKYPDGLKPGTSTKNWFFVRGGYSCRHSAMAVRG